MGKKDPVFLPKILAKRASALPATTIEFGALESRSFRLPSSPGKRKIVPSPCTL
jgi:hypothetical protein